MRPPLFFFLMITLAIQGYLWFHSNFSIGFPISVRDSIGILTGVFCRHDSPLCEQEDSSEPDSPAGYCGRVRIPISSVAAARGEFCCLILSTLFAESQCWEIVTSTLNELIRQSGVHVPQCQRVETQLGFQNRHTTLCVNGYVIIFAFLYACLSYG